MAEAELTSKDRRLKFIETLATLGSLLAIVVAVQKLPNVQEEQTVGFFTVVLIVASLYSYSFILYKDKVFWKYRLAAGLLASAYAALLTLALSLSLIPALATWASTEYSVFFGKLTVAAVVVLAIVIVTVAVVFFFLMNGFILNKLAIDTDWTGIGEAEFMQRAGNIHVMWTHSFTGTKTKFRRVTIESDYEFKDALLQANLPWYHDSKGKDCGYDHPEAVSYTVKQWVKKKGNAILPIKDPKLEVEIVTAGDTTLQKRLIVDGCNRCVAIAKYGLKKSQLSEITLFEAYGDWVADVFKADFDDLKKKGKPKSGSAVGPVLSAAGATQ